MARNVPCLAVAVLAAIGVARPAMAENPQDLSLVGTFAYDTNLATIRPDLDHLRIEEVELAYQGYLSPFSRADAYLSIHPDGKGGFAIEPEEVYLSNFDLPLGMGLKLGKYKANFGKLNRFHPEQWFFVSRPLVLQRYLGDDGLQDLGAELAVPVANPWDALLQVTLGVQDGANEWALGEPGAGKAENARLSAGVSIGDDASLECGVSGLTGFAAGTEAALRANLCGLDATWRWRPDQEHALTSSAEILAGQRPDVPGMPSGWYWSTDWQVAREHDFGLRLDQAWGLRGSPLERQASLFYTFSATETNKYRLELQHHWDYGDSSGNPAQEDSQLLLRAIFSLGPHKHAVQF